MNKRFEMVGAKMVLQNAVKPEQTEQLGDQDLLLRRAYLTTLTLSDPTDPDNLIDHAHQLASYFHSDIPDERESAQKLLESNQADTNDDIKRLKKDSHLTNIAAAILLLSPPFAFILAYALTHQPNYLILGGEAGTQVLNATLFRERLKRNDRNIADSLIKLTHLKTLANPGSSLDDFLTAALSLA